MRITKFVSICLSILFLNACVSLSQENKEYLSTQDSAIVQLSSTFTQKFSPSPDQSYLPITIKYQGPSANLSALYYDYSDKSHWYEKEIGAIRNYLKRKEIDVPKMVLEQLELQLSKNFGLQVRNDDNNENYLKFEIVDLALTFATPHPLGKKVNPVIGLNVNIDRNGNTLFTGFGFSPTKFSGPDREELETWLSDDELFEVGINKAIDSAVTMFIDQYRREIK